MRYEVLTGREWQLVSGETQGQGHQACVSHLGYSGQTAQMNWNSTFNAVYRTLEVSGWPKLVIWFEGPNWLGNDVLKGYGCVP